GASVVTARCARRTVRSRRRPTPTLGSPRAAPPRRAVAGLCARAVRLLRRPRAPVRATARSIRGAARPRATARGSHRRPALLPRAPLWRQQTEKPPRRGRLTRRGVTGKLKAMGERSDFRPDDTGELKERWRAYIQDRRLNVTSQREAIVEQFLRT